MQQWRQKWPQNSYIRFDKLNIYEHSNLISQILSFIWKQF